MDISVKSVEERRLGRLQTPHMIEILLNAVTALHSNELNMVLTLQHPLKKLHSVVRRAQMQLSETCLHQRNTLLS